MRRPLALAAFLVLPAACGGAPDAPSTTSTEAQPVGAASTSYVAIDSFWTTPAEQAAWSAAVANLKLQFDDICGDTFCDGDYANFEPLELDCSVSSVRGSVKTCTWVFAGSNSSFDTSTGRITDSIPHYDCTFGTTLYARGLTSFLAQGGSLQATLPGLGDSIYDVIGECLQHPIDAARTAPAASPPGTYVDASQASTTDQGAWYDMTENLASSFASLCPSRYCATYPDLTSYLFSCSIDAASTKIHMCRWAFAGSSTSTDAKNGSMTVGETSYDCVVPAHGPVQGLIDVFGAAGSDPPLDRTLPGESETLGQALAKCLK